MWMLGTLLNSRSQISEANAKALKEAMLRGLKVVIATGKVRTEQYPSNYLFLLSVIYTTSDYFGDGYC